MKAKFIPVYKAGSYSFSNEVITVHYDGKSEEIDLSGFPEGGIFTGIDPEVVELRGSQILRGVERIDGELQVTLCQQHPKNPTHWVESEWVNTDSYDPETLYVKPNGNPPDVKKLIGL